MSFIARSRLRSLYLSHRHFSAPSIPTSENPNSILARKQNSRAALALLKSESDPNRIIDIARAASLTPASHLDRTALSITVSKLSKTQSSATPTALRSFLDEFKSRPDLQSERSISYAIILYGQAGMLDQAIHTFQHLDELGVPQRTAESLNALLYACLLNEDHDQLIRIFREFPKVYNISPDIKTYNRVIRSFCKSGKSTSAYAILDEMGQEGIKPNKTTYNILLSGLSLEGKHEEVEKVLEMMEKNDCCSGTSPHDAKIRSLCRAKKMHEAKALFDGIVSSGAKPDPVTYCHLIIGFCKEGDLEEAKRLFDEMGEKGCEPGSGSYFTLIYYLCQGGQFDTALRLGKECMEKDWWPCFSTMKLLVDGLVKDSKMKEAREIVGKLKERFPKTAQMWKDVEDGWPQKGRRFSLFG
ncbi:small ribosomal subunit protein mS86 (rPPR1)-like [Magnolia sinica]|uniref:small ribosomal subunit protein mS86 (rPPR1)-like n=1 Tax=Magnolia sinica TaxID=86752 RepID=UPI0026592F3D|nr:small ribosomal subunit protein mS86 (rPPR1)-like [Magnolia sinica]XP_058093615.1 small ribosomal subunit protein mS86 (rPPR1)-like [Magnolia sinica]XP_058093623.1 small ribosomal subunit protein mS86 (rPPR1)-like [Magnolia sinica]